MRLAHLRLHNFRNHQESSFDFGGGSNIIAGGNGQGKTNIIEAISYLCLTKSFYAGSDAHVLTFHESLFEVEGSLLSDKGKAFDVRAAYTHTPQEKLFTINRKVVEPLSSVVGTFPVVICSPEHTPITNRGPVERRRFADFVIAQANPVYLQDLVEYRRVVRHRNAILVEARKGRQNPENLLEPWNEHLAVRGGRIMHRRMLFAGEFLGYIRSAYHALVEDGEEPGLAYLPAGGMESSWGEVEFANMLRGEIRAKTTREIQFGVTLAGPHRDEFHFTLNGLELRKYASQGQHKSFLVALKIAEFHFLKERCGETPILLLDDIFSELDEQRSARLLQLVETLSQAFITTTDPHFFGRTAGHREKRRLFLIKAGMVVGENSAAA